MIKQVVVYKVVDEIKLKHLYLAYHIIRNLLKAGAWWSYGMML
jgi:hypothetical protein